MASANNPASLGLRPRALISRHGATDLAPNRNRTPRMGVGGWTQGY